MILVGKAGAPADAGINSREIKNGAAEKTRTSTRVTGQRPQRCASTSSATAAHLVEKGA